MCLSTRGGGGTWPGPGGCLQFGGCLKFSGGSEIFGGGCLKFSGGVSPIFLGGGFLQIFFFFFFQFLFPPKKISSGMQPPPPRRSMRGRYAPYWNAFLFFFHFHAVISKSYTKQESIPVGCALHPEADPGCCPPPRCRLPYRQTPPSGCRMTNAFENTTLPQTSFAGILIGKRPQLFNSLRLAPPQGNHGSVAKRVGPPARTTI